MTPREIVQKIAAPSPIWMWIVRVLAFLTPLLIAGATTWQVAQIKLAIYENNEILRKYNEDTYLRKDIWGAWKKEVYSRDHDN